MITLRAASEEDTWKWFVSHAPVFGKIHLISLESSPVSMVKLILNLISQHCPQHLYLWPSSEGIRIDFHSELNQVDVQDDNNIPLQGQHEFVCVHTSHVENPPPAITKAVSLGDSPIIRSSRCSLVSLMKPKNCRYYHSSLDPSPSK